MKVRRICLYGDMGTTVAPQSQWSVFPYKSLYILYVFKFFNCHKTFPLCIIGLKFSYVHNRKASKASNSLFVFVFFKKPFHKIISGSDGSSIFLYLG